MSGSKDKRTGRVGFANQGRLLDMIAEGMTAPAIADVFDVNPESIRKFARRRGLEIRPVDQAMENHPSWAGGTTRDRRGYELVRVAHDGEYGYLIRARRAGDRRGYAPKHRVVMHDKLGRKLEPLEVVHHKDGDIRNNDPSNLEVYVTNADHLRDTLKGKVPKWTPEGYARIGMRTDLLRKKSELVASDDHPKTDDPQ